jgi:DNA polymerase III alpha subunit
MLEQIVKNAKRSSSKSPDNVRETDAAGVPRLFHCNVEVASRAHRRAGAVEFDEAARKLGARPILGASRRRDKVRVTALIAEPSGWRSLCRIISRLHGPRGHLFPLLLSESNEGLHLLLDDPHLLKPPLTDAYQGRLWAELVRPGKSESAEAALLEAASATGAKHRVS